MQSQQNCFKYKVLALLPETANCPTLIMKCGLIDGQNHVLWLAYDCF